MSWLLEEFRTVNLYHVLETVGLLVIGLLFYSSTYQWFPPGVRRVRIRRALLNGAVFGGLTVAMMIARIEVHPGVFIDLRVVPVALIGLFEGWPAALVAALAGSAYRLWLGGSGAWPGVATLLLVVLAAEAVRRWAARAGGARLRHSLALGALAYAATVFGFALLGAPGLARFARVWEDYLLVVAIGIGLVARLFQDVVSEHQLKAEQARFRAVLDDASDAVRIVDSDTGTILDVNRADCELHGYTREELVGRNMRDFWPSDPELRARREAAVTETRARGFTRTSGNPYQTRSGAIVPVDSTRRMVEHGGRRFDIVIFRPATERLASEAAQREVAALQAATLLARAAAHEINSPLSIIMGYLQMMAERGGEGGKDTKWVTQMLDAARRIRDTVERLKTLIRIEATTAGGDVPGMLDTRKSSAPAPGPFPAGSPTSTAPPPDPSAR